MADEINRASPRTQSALLQAMQEHHVTVAGARHDLPVPFHVLATQNPLEQEGAYPLPEAQLDRFLMQIDVGYPDRAAERRILIETTGDSEAAPKPAMTAAELMAAQRLVRRAPIGESVVEAILDLVRAARPGEGDPELTKAISWGPGPRAAQALMLATAPARSSTVVSRPRATTSSRWPSPCSSTAWRLPTPRAPRARRSLPSSRASSPRSCADPMATAAPALRPANSSGSHALSRAPAEPRRRRAASRAQR